MKNLILSILLLVSFNVQADEWREMDTYREVGYQVLNVVDWSQTRYIAEHPDQFKEVSLAWAIGEHPTTAQVDTIMLESAVIHYVVARLLPVGAWRTTFQSITIIEKGFAVTNNATIGIKMSFSF